MKKTETDKLIFEHKEIMSKLRRISIKLLSLVDGTISGNEEAYEQMDQLKLKQKEIMQLFFRVSSLLLKAIPTELQVNSAKVNKNANFETLEKEDKKDNYISAEEISILKKYLIRYEEDGNTEL